MDHTHHDDDARQRAVSGSELVETITRVVAALLHIDPRTVRPNVPLLDLGAESFDFLHLVFRVEQMYAIRLQPTLAIPDRHTVNTYVRAVADELARGAPGK